MTDAKNKIINDKLLESFTEILLREVIEEWLEALTDETARAYRSAMNELSLRGFLNIHTPLLEFGSLKHEKILQQIKKVPDWRESTKQARSAAYISFSRFLEEKTNMKIRNLSD